MSKTRNTFFLTLLAALAIGAGSIRAADTGATTTPPPAKTTGVNQKENPSKAPLVFTGRIVVVDKTAGTITLSVEGKLRAFKVVRNVRIVHNGELVTLADLVAGQRVSILTRPAGSETLEVVAVAVEPDPKALTAAGAETEPAEKTGNTRPSGPFNTLVNPANSLGPVVSPSE